MSRRCELFLLHSYSALILLFQRRAKEYCTVLCMDCTVVCMECTVVCMDSSKYKIIDFSMNSHQFAEMSQWVSVHCTPLSHILDIYCESAPKYIFLDKGISKYFFHPVLYGLHPVLYGFWGQFATSSIDLVPICYVLYRCGANLLRSTSFGDQFAAFCIALVPICCVLHRLIRVLLNLVSFCCILHKFGIKMLRSALILPQIAPLCIDSGSNCCVLQQFRVNLLRLLSIRGSYSSLEYELIL